MLGTARGVRNYCGQHDIMNEKLTCWLGKCHWPQHYRGFQGQALGTAHKLPPACHTESQPVQWQGGTVCGATSDKQRHELW